MQRKTILFIPSTFYLSDEAFIKIPKANNFKFIYLNPNDASFNHLNLKHIKGFECHFDKYINLSKDLYSGKNIFFKFISYQVKKIQIIWLVWKLMPALIITTSDGTFTSRILARYFPKIPFILIQTALVTVKDNRYKEPSRSWILRILKKYLSFLFFPFLDSVKPFGLNHKNAILLLWGKSTQSLLSPYVSNQIIHLVGNILFEKQYETDPPKNSILILAPHAHNLEEAIDFCKDLEFIINKFSILKFMIRIHPIMDRKIFEDYFSKKSFKNIFILPKQEKIIDSLLKSNVVISQYSAATFDALAMGRKVILFRKIEEERLSYWYQDMDIPKLNNTQCVVRVLSEYIDNGTLNQFCTQKDVLRYHWETYGKNSINKSYKIITEAVKERIKI